MARRHQALRVMPGSCASCQTKLSNAAIVTHRGRPTTTYSSQDDCRHNILVLAQGIEP
jgi:hypothetical protein